MVGLGNPGPEYEGNRHNVGFMVLDALIEGSGVEPKEVLGGRSVRLRLEGHDVVLLEPSTFMNGSGRAVVAAMDAQGIELGQVLVVHDDLDLPLGTIRLKRGGGAGGHNGLKSIIAECGGPDFDRLRVGIGRPEVGPIIDWVLGDFRESEGAALDDVLQDATRAVVAVVVDGTPVAMNTVNARKRTPKRENDLLAPADRLGANDREDP